MSSFSEEQQKTYSQKLMIDFSFDQWKIASDRHIMAEGDLKQAARDFEIVHQQSLQLRTDREIITDGLLFRGLVWMSSFSDYAYKRLYSLAECIPPFVKVSCTDEQTGWENYPVPYFTLRQKVFTDKQVDDMKRWFTSFAQGRRRINCPIIYAQNGRFGQLHYVHDVHTGRGQVISNEWGNTKVLLDNDFSYCVRYIAENWWYFPASKR